MKLLIIAAIILNMNICAAEDLKFIDSKDDFGYFIDIDTIKLESRNTFSVNMVIIRANLNEMDVIDLQINHELKNYTVYSIKTLSYDERAEIKSDMTRRQAKTYAEKSLMGEIVEFVINGDFKD